MLDIGAPGDTGDGATRPWTLRDDVLAGGRDRQVLVVGDGVVGRTLTALLQQAGYEPVLAATPGAHPEREVVQLDAGALAALDRLELADDVREQGTRIESIRVPRTTASERPDSEAPMGGAPSCEVVVVAASALRRLLDAAWPLGDAAIDRGVTDAATDGDAITVEFGDGVRESFDAVVDTVGTRALRAPGADAAPSHSFTQYVRRCDGDVGAPNELWDVWMPGALVQVVGTGDAAAWMRVTTPRGDVEGLAPADHLRDVAGIDASIVAETCRDGVATRVGQARLDAAAPTRANWGAGRVARCGPAAVPVAPAVGRDPARGVRDAIAFVAALARHDHTTTAAIDRYATARERTATQRRRQPTRGTDRRPTSTPPADTLGTLAAARRRALDALLTDDDA